MKITNLLLDPLKKMQTKNLYGYLITLKNKVIIGGQGGRSPPARATAKLGKVRLGKVRFDIALPFFHPI